MQARQVIASRSRSIWRVWAISRGPGVRHRRALRVAQSISGRTFDNAFCALKPCCQFVGPCLVPTVWYRSEAPLIPLRLEAKPPTAVFARDLKAPLERVFAPLRCAAAVRKGRKISRWPAARRAPVRLSSFGGLWRHQPDLPPLSRRIDKSPITHFVLSPADSGPRSAITSYGFARRVPKTAEFTLEARLIFGNVRISDCRNHL
jgi:hypothetical protein